MFELLVTFFESAWCCRL